MPLVRHEILYDYKARQLLYFYLIRQINMVLAACDMLVSFLLFEMAIHPI